MWTVFVVGLMTGLDNLQAASGVGMLPLASARKWQIALTFAGFEAGMPLLGLLLGRQSLAVLDPFGEWVAPIALASCGLLILALTLRQRRTTAVANSRWVLFGLPLSLSFDNLLAGVGIGALGGPLLPTALLIGGISGTMSLLGVLVGARVRKFLPPGELGLISGAWLVMAALLMVYFDQ